MPDKARQEIKGLLFSPGADKRRVEHGPEWDAGAVMEDDGERPAAKAAEKPLDLDLLSIEELEERIMALELEIERYRAAIEKKFSARGAADSVFRS